MTIGTPCGATCHRPTGKAAHCTVCHFTFGAVTNFDRHRVNGRCLDPTTLGLTLHGALWRRSMTQDARLRLSALAVKGLEPVAGTSGNPRVVSS